MQGSHPIPLHCISIISEPHNLFQGKGETPSPSFLNMSHFLESERLYFRAVEESDLTDNYVSWMNDPQINMFMETWHFPHGKENIRAYIKAHYDDRDEPFFAIILKNQIISFGDDDYKSGDLHIGNIKLGPVNWIHRYADISVFIGKKNLWGNGYATEAIKLITEYAFKKLGLHKVKAGIYSRNVGSIRAFQRAGFLVEAVLTRHVFLSGEWIDLYLMGLINE